MKDNDAMHRPFPFVNSQIIEFSNHENPILVSAETIILFKSGDLSVERNMSALNI